MKAPVRLLHLEDNPSDGELISATLAREGMECEIQRVATRQGFVEQLEAGGCDLILADYNLPSFDGLSALKLARRRRPETPFLFVSGFIGEEVALESLKNGATDYVFKHNLARLAPAVRRALEEARERRERETAEAALHDREAALRSFFDTAPFMMGIVELGHDQLIHLSGNAASARFLGAAPAAMANSPVEKWGLPRNVIARLRAQCQQSQDEARAVEAEHCFPWQGKLREVALTVSPLPGTAGHGARCCYVAEEVTDKKQLERQFLRAQRLESVGTLASGLAHDLNNVLAPIMMALKLFRAKLPDAEDQELLSNLEASARRGADIIRQVLTFARGVEGERQPVPLPSLIGELTRMLRDTFPRSIQFEVNVPESLPPVVGDATQIYQVLMNLCVNARDAMPGGGTLRINARSLHLGAEAARFHPQARPGDYLVIDVVDTGSGIASGVIDKIFDPFFTTKELGHGTGLGLPTTLSIIKSHGGWITVNSEPGQGAHFSVHLPAGPTAGDNGSRTAPADQARSRGELILVVDDEATMRLVTRTTLVSAGYRVLLANDGREALAFHGRHREEIALVLTDMMMPVMDGPALVAELRKASPHLPVITMSGLLDARGAKQQEGAPAAFLEKPFTAERLLTTVRAALASAPRALK